MKKQFLILVAVCAFKLNYSQETAFTPRTGDAEMDAVLQEVSTKAKDDASGFITETATAFNVPKTKVQELLQVMDPGDAYMTLQTAEVTNKPVDEVKDAYIKEKDKGWGQIAKNLGIKPGSKEFHVLKSKIKGNKEKKGKEKKEKGGNSKGKGKDKRK